MGDAVFVEKRKSLQGLLQDALCHGRRIADLHFPPSRVELRQFLDHGVYTWTHGLKDQALVDAVGAAVLELV